MLYLICPCTHSALLPEESLSLVCSQCQRRLVLTWFNGWSEWRAELRARVWGRVADGERFRVEWRAA